jgi:hypothetical protein
MRLSIIALAAAAALAAGCDKGPQQPATSSSTSPAAGSSGAPQVGPKGDEVKLPPSPQGTKGSPALPDPGDANDHSNPQHDAREKAGSGKTSDR